MRLVGARVVRDALRVCGPLDIIAAVARTPFGSALGNALVGQPCINTSSEGNRHERVTLTMQLEPLTDYILDLEAQPAASNPAYPPFRRHFTTSRYASMAELAADVAPDSRAAPPRG